MQVQIETSPIDTLAADALAVICLEAKDTTQDTGVDAGPILDPEIAQQSGWLGELRNSGEFTGKLYETALLHRPQSLRAKRLMVIGGGTREKFSTAEARNIGGVLVRALKCKGVRSIILALPNLRGIDAPVAAQVMAATEGAILGAWEPDKYKSDPKVKEKQIDFFTIAVPGGNSGELKEALRRARYRQVSKPDARSG